MKLENRIFYKSLFQNLNLFNPNKTEIFEGSFFLEGGGGSICSPPLHFSRRTNLISI